jgi:catechol 2,3-dioxygenase
MKVVELGHVNLYVSDLDRSARFYGELLGFPEVARSVLYNRRCAFFTLSGRHHDLALIEVGGEAASNEMRRPGLNHIGFKVGDSVAELRAMRDQLAAAGIKAFRTVDHRVCKSIHVHDPDGIVVELYADGDPKLWAQDPTALAYAEPCGID